MLVHLLGGNALAEVLAVGGVPVEVVGREVRVVDVLEVMAVRMFTVLVETAGDHPGEVDALGVAVPGGLVVELLGVDLVQPVVSAAVVDGAGVAGEFHRVGPRLAAVGRANVPEGAIRGVVLLVAWILS